MTQIKYNIIISVLYLICVHFPTVSQATATPPPTPPPLGTPVTGDVCIAVDSDDNCIEWAPNALANSNGNLAEAIRPLFCDLEYDINTRSVDDRICNDQWYPPEVYGIRPVVKQYYHFEWSKSPGGVLIYGRATPMANISMFSTPGTEEFVEGSDVFGGGASQNPDDLAAQMQANQIEYNAGEQDDGHVEEISTLWPLWTKWHLYGGINLHFDPVNEPPLPHTWINYPYDNSNYVVDTVSPASEGGSLVIDSYWVSHGDYDFPFQDHPGSENGNINFTTMILNMDYRDIGTDANGRPLRGTPGRSFMPAGGEATIFNWEIETGVITPPVIRDAEVGVPNTDSGNSYLAALAIGAMGLFGSSKSVNDSYGQKTWQKLTEQVTTMDLKVEEQNQATADHEQMEKSAKEIQEEKVDAVADTAPDELVCTIVSISKKDVVQSSLRKKVNKKAIRNMLMSNVQRKKGSLGSLPERERIQWRVEEVRQRHCTLGGEGSAFEQFCVKTAGNQDNELGQFSPECLHGTKTIDSDPSAGDVDPSCMQNLLITSPAHNPIKLPNASKLRDKGTSEYESDIAEYVPSLTNHAIIISDSMATMHASTVSTPGESVNEFRALMQELNFSQEEIDSYIPASGTGLSESAQLEIVSKFMIANPKFFIRLQTNEANVSRVRALIRSISLNLDHHINETVKNKGRQMSGLHALLLKDDRKAANAALVNANPE